MYAKLKTHLIGLAAALSFVVVGFGLGEAPRSAGPVQAPDAVLAQQQPVVSGQDDAAPARRGALKRHLAMPYVSFAALLPRREP